MDMLEANILAGETAFGEKKYMSFLYRNIKCLDTLEAK